MFSSTMFRNIAATAATVAIAATLLFCAAEACARDADSLAQQYGKGVHAYFAGDYAGTLLELTRAINSGSKDPRCHYFRALALVKLGQADRADSDMAQGAELEILDRDGYYPVNRSLERVQGRSRLVLEEHRRRARQAAVEREKEINRKRYEQLRQREVDVLRRPLIVPLEKLAQPTTGSPAVIRTIDQDEPPLPVTEQSEATKEDGSGDRDPFALPNWTSRDDSLSASDAPTVAKKVKARTLGKVLTRIFRRSIGLGAVKSGEDPAQPVDEGNPFDIDEEANDSDGGNQLDP